MTEWLERIAGARGVREVEVTEQVTHVRATMTTEASELRTASRAHLGMARKFTRDYADRQLNAHIGAGYATLALLEQLRCQS
jgi:hypothetical protein